VLYSFDTSSLLNGRRDLLPPNVFGSVWQQIEVAIVDGEVQAIDVVRDELAKRDDEVLQWVKTQHGCQWTLVTARWRTWELPVGGQ
jgi:hypothetical protein